MMRVLVAALLVVGGAVSYAQLDGTFASMVDVGSGTGTIEAEVVDNSTHDPWYAYEDVNDDDLYTEGVDVLIPDEEILDGDYTVSRPQHGLVIPKSVGPIKVDGPIRFHAGNQAHLTLEVRLAATGSIELVAGTDADLEGLVAEAPAGISVDAGGTARLAGAYLRADAGSVAIDAQQRVDGLGMQVEAGTGITITSKKGTLGIVDTSLRSDGGLAISSQRGTINADRSTLEGTGALDLSAGGDVRVKAASLETPDEITLTAGNPNEAIFVQDARFADADDTAKAGPKNVEIVGTPAEGAIEA